MNASFLNARDFGAAGSQYKTEVQTVAGSNLVTVRDIGDFQVGDEVILSKCNVHFRTKVLFERRDTSPVNRRPWKHNQPLGDRIELEGYDGSQGCWVVYYIDIAPEKPGTFRWSNDFGTIWHEDIPLTEGWIPLEGTIRVKINSFKEREYGCTAAFVCTDRLVTVIEKIEGNQLHLAAPANRTTIGEISHSDTLALQRAIDTAVAEKKNLFLPNGTYKLTGSLHINHATSFTLEGESAGNTVIDNSFGNIGVEQQEGSCFYINEGEEVNIKNLSMFGGSKWTERNQMGLVGALGGSSVWGFYLKKSNATCTHQTKRVYIENCHARNMSAECFYSAGVGREKAAEDNAPDQYSRSIIYMRCSVEDCARNAFNNNDYAEGTSLLYCRARNVSGCAWEGASRFVKVHGCYFCNCGSFGLGNVRRRNEIHDKLPTGQHIITDNYFESGISYGSAMIMIGSMATQVLIQNNSFVNFNSNAIWVMGEGREVDSPPENVIISGNCFDMTAINSESKERYAIKITSNYVTVADNQIYARGAVDEKFTGIIVSDDAYRITIHDNSITGCGHGIRSEKVPGEVGIVQSDTEFYRSHSDVDHKPMLLRPRSHRYKGWHLVWLADGSESELLDFDPLSLVFTLKEPKKLSTGDAFYLYNPTGLRWMIHHNMLDNCSTPLLLDTYSGKRAMLESNQID